MEEESPKVWRISKQGESLGSTKDPEDSLPRAIEQFIAVILSRIICEVAENKLWHTHMADRPCQIYLTILFLTVGSPIGLKTYTFMYYIVDKSS